MPAEKPKQATPGSEPAAESPFTFHDVPGGRVGICDLDVRPPIPDGFYLSEVTYFKEAGLHRFVIRESNRQA